jgi:hypothetical protein
MGEYIDQVPVEVQDHIRQITRTSGLPDTEEAVDMIAQGWLEKKHRFEKILARMELEEVETLPKSDPRGCLVMTYSGSLLNIGPMRDQVRMAQYASIGLRKDVPETAVNIGSELAADVVIGAPVSFVKGPISSSSPAFKVAVTAEELNLEEQENLITKATRALTREFIEVNREIEAEES